MSRFAYPLPERIKLRAWRTINGAVDLMRTPIRRPDVLLVTGGASEAKVREVENRLRFLFSHLGGSPEFPRAGRARLRDYLRHAGVVAVDGASIPMVARRHVSWVADLDYETNPFDGWALMDLGATLASGAMTEVIAAGRARFTAHVEALTARGPRPVYLFGTGPSLRLAQEHSYSDGIAIVCNTIVRDADLWHRLNPAFFTAGDAIYHFGNNDHAQAFRADALRRLQESEGRTLFVYPAPFDVIVRSEFREVEELLVPIPWGEHTDITVDLVSQFELPRTGNVLNVLLLPLGCTLSTDIRLWGFDGRAPTDSGFWSNSPVHAYPDLMQSIRDSHPAFFADLVPEGNENKYVTEVHGDWLNERLTDAEQRGFNFRMLHASWTPTLQQRYCGDDSRRAD